MGPPRAAAGSFAKLCGIVAAISACAGVVFSQDAGAERTTLRIPDDVDIERVVAECYSHPFGAKDVPQFEISKEEFKEIADRLKQSKVDKDAGFVLDEIGSIRIRTKTGYPLRICWFIIAPKDRLRFSCGGVRFITTGELPERDDEALAFDRWIRQISKKDESLTD
jgi:hypothetical protein